MLLETRNKDTMIDRVYTNSTDANLYATLDAALAVYGHKLQKGKVVPTHTPDASGIQYEYVEDSADFHNGQDTNLRMMFRVHVSADSVFAPPAELAFIGYTMLQGHQEAAVAERKELRAKQEAVAMSALAALPESVFGDLRDPETNSIILHIVDRITENPAIANAVFSGVENRQYKERLFRSFLVRSYNFMGSRTEAEQEQLESFTD